jgi:putative PIN family toxin of toxin-antitoxin system
MIEVVLDTNVIVSAHLNEEGLQARALRLAFSRAIVLYLSEPILAEYEFILRRSKFSFDQRRVDQSLARLNQVGIVVTPTQTLSISPDETDTRFLECSEEAQANYLVTGNKRHFPKRWKNTAVVNGREFLELISPDLKS